MVNAARTCRRDVREVKGRECYPNSALGTRVLCTFAFRTTDEDSPPPGRADPKAQAAELTEQLRTSNTPLQEESAQMLDQGNILRQELHNDVLTQYAGESQMSSMRNTLDYQKQRMHTEEQQLQATKRQFHEQNATVQSLPREIQRLTRSEASLQQQHAIGSSSMPCRCIHLPKKAIKNISLFLS